jgi:hypothetical protein
MKPNHIATVIALCLLLVGVVACRVSQAYKSTMIETGILQSK